MLSLGCEFDENGINEIAQKYSFTGGELASAIRRLICRKNADNSSLTLSDIEELWSLCVNWEQVAGVCGIDKFLQVYWMNMPACVDLLCLDATAREP